jgi:serum/glucocorticoid-regulated kinase 2
VPSTPAPDRDPFAPLTNGATSHHPGATALAGYLTTIANDQMFRTARPWRRFVRVRTDDLESVRVERAIKRVRSDLAAHASPKSPEAGGMQAVVEAPAPDEVERLGWGEEDDTGAPAIAHQLLAAENRPTSRASTKTSKAPADHAVPPRPVSVVEETAPEPAAAVEGLPSAEEDSSTAPTASAPSPVPGTPTAESHVARIPRSHSADPTKAGARLSRLVVEASAADTTAETTDTEGVSTSETGDDESATDAGADADADAGAAGKVRRRKSRKARPVARKAVIDDFEMLRVLGKGCAGKVLLVRHKQTADLYALKAITKRHVLAHQELQHTLTEQAVLKRMAAEGTDPFVVKLWWSFHDKDNLFLVLVRRTRVGDDVH